MLPRQLVTTVGKNSEVEFLKEPKKIQARSGGNPFKPFVTEIIHQMRNERDEQLIQACFPQDED